MNNQVTIQKVTEADLIALLNFSKTTFLEAFAHLNNPDDLEVYVGAAFNAEKLRAELQNTESAFYFALLNGDIAGYIKLNFGQAQTEFQLSTELEVERIYVSAQHQRKQIGQQLISFAIQTGKAQNLEAIWLGVWEDNHQAIHFYERHGFKKFSQHYFMVGTDQQIDLLLKQQL